MSTPSAQCPALFIAAPSSGQGKTTVTAALARLYARQGMDVRVFKTGPDYLDPQILALASGAFVTTVTDVVGFFAFLGLAASVLL